jgi:conjugal transfer/type IV secretion protein DotA/TraY
MKRFRIVSALAALCCLLLSSAVLANTTTLGEITQAAHRSEDKSRQALVSVFGQVVNNPLAASNGSGADTLLASLFQVINGALLVVGAFFACYIMFRRLTQIAHDGSIFGRDKATLWGPLRLVFGLASLVPTANGWCLSQLLMLWAASVMGIGIANMGTDAVVAAFENGQSMVVQPAMPSTLTLARSLYEANLCLHSVNAGQAMTAASGGFDFSREYIQQNPTNAGFILSNPAGTKVCGGAEIDITQLEPASQSTNWFSETIDTSTIYQAHLRALSEMQSQLSESARGFVTAVMQGQQNSIALPDAQASIESAAQVYENLLNRDAGTKQGDIANLAGQLSSSIKEAGWWTLGAWYQTFAQANSKLSSAISGKAKVFGESHHGNHGISDLRQNVFNAYQAQQANSTNASALGRMSSTAGSDTNNIVSSIFSGPGQKIVNYMVGVDAGAEARGTVNPLIKMKNLGDYTLGAAETALGIYVTAKVATSVADGLNAAGVAVKVANFFTGVADTIKGLLDAISPIILLILIPLFVIGAGLSIYLPLVPFIVWFGAIINWLVIVCEAVIAAPLWAMTHLGDDGDGMGQRTGHGYIFLLNVMVRPILMVIGFVLGGAILIVGGTVLNELYGIAVANVQFDSITGLLSVIVFLGVYFMMCLNLIHTCFNLIYIVPDNVINWVGGNASTTLGRETNDQIKNSFSILAGKFEHMMPRGSKGDGGKSQPPDGNGMKR